MRNYLIAIDDKLQPFLKEGDYSFIAPVDPDFLEPFTLRAGKFAPRLLGRSIHHILRDKRATRTTLNYIPNNIPLQIFVVSKPSHNLVLKQQNIDDYCTNNGIDVKEILGTLFT